MFVHVLYWDFLFFIFFLAELYDRPGELKNYDYYLAFCILILYAGWEKRGSEI